MFAAKGFDLTLEKSSLSDTNTHKQAQGHTACVKLQAPSLFFKTSPTSVCFYRTLRDRDLKGQNV